MNRFAWMLSLSFLLSCSTAPGQSVTLPGSTVPLFATDGGSAVVPAGSASTVLSFTVEGDIEGNNSFDVATSDPSVIVSLILPSGTEVTSSNAASLGFSFTTVAAGTNDNVQSLTPMSFPGTHTVIQIPGGQPSGTYQIKANASSSTADSGIIATYFASSTVGVSATTDSANYAVNDTVIISGLAFDGTTPVTGATVTAAVSVPSSLSATVGNFQLLTQQAVSAILTDYTYSATLTNSGPSAQTVVAQLAALPSGVTVLSDTLIFGDVGANSSATSLNTITIESNPSQSFNPSTLQWNVTTPGTPTAVALLDSGQFDAATGDGIYTGTFTPQVAGAYSAVLSITGTSSAGNAFSRKATTQFTVTQQLASFSSFSDSQQAGGIVVTANVSVQTAGTYRFDLQLQASNGRISSQTTQATLATGSQQIAATFSNQQLFTLGVNGPYERINAVLIDVVPFGSLIAASTVDAGPTASYTLSSFAPSVYFTGQNSAAGVILTTGGTTFDVLQIKVGVSVATSQTCDWNGTLTDTSGNAIDVESNGGTVSAGSTSVVLNFNGYSIARAANGPYIVTAFTIRCGAIQASASPLFQTQAFTASQFTSVTSDFSITTFKTPAAATAGSTFTVGLFLSSVGGFSSPVGLSVSGLPSGLSGSFSFPTLPGSGFSGLVATSSTSTPGGSYPVTIVGRSGSLSHSISTTINVLGSTTTVASNASAAVSSSNQAVLLSATVTSAASGTVNGGAVVFAVFDSQNNQIGAQVSGSVSSGSASATYTLPGGTAAANYLISASYSGTTTLAGSSDSTHTLTVSGASAATPAFSPAAGTYSSTQSVTISTATSGASIRYTTDGSTPSETVGTLYSAAISVSATTTIKAIAYASGYTDSSIASVTYTIGPAGPPSRASSSMLDTTNTLSTSLAGLFVMNEGTGSIDQNLVNGQSASFSGSTAPTWNTSDPSIVFYGGVSTTSYLNAGSDPIFDQLPTNQITIVAKVYINSLTAAGVCEKNDGNAVAGFVFGWDSSGALRLTVEKDSNMRVATAGAAISAGQWVQVAFTWDGTLGTAAGAHLFVNGTEQTKASSSDGSGPLTYSSATNQPFRIGNASFDPMAGSLNGKMAYLAVYSGRILTPAEMAQLDSQLPITNPSGAHDVVGTITTSGTPVTATTTTSGQNARLAFLGSIEQQPTIQLSSNTMGSVAVTLENRDHSTLTSFTSSASSFTLPQSWIPSFGIYTISIQPSNAGSVTVALTVSNNPPSRPAAAALDTSNTLASNLAGYFVMNEGSGTSDHNLVDGQAANFSGSSAPTWNTTDPSIVFNGGGSLNSYVNAGTDLTFDQLTPGQMTIVAKVYVNTVAAAGISEKNDGNVNSGFVFGWDNNGSLKLTVVKTGADMRVATLNGTISAGQWVQVAFTWDGTVGTASAAHLFVNGTQQPLASTNDGTGTIDYANATNQPFRIGNASFDEPGSLSGKIAYLAVYKGRILTPSEMNQLDSAPPLH
jgi:hypothetical protein